MSETRGPLSEAELKEARQFAGPEWQSREWEIVLGLNKALIAALARAERAEGERDRLQKLHDMGAVEVEMDRVWKAEAQNAALRGALETVNKMLTIPAAEYVPAIPDAWKVIEQALSLKPTELGEAVRGAVECLEALALPCTRHDYDVAALDRAVVKIANSALTALKKAGYP